MEVISKSTIEQWIVSYLSVGKRGAKSAVALSAIVAALLHRLKTGEQWRWLPLKQFFEPGTLPCNGVYYYFNKWFKDGSFQKAWIAILQHNKRLPDLSSLHLDGSHTLAKQGGEATLVIRVERRLKPPECPVLCRQAGPTFGPHRRVIITMLMKSAPYLNKWVSCRSRQLYR